MSLPRSSHSLWLDGVADDRFRGSTVPSQADVVIVGAGIAGLTTAEMLVHAGVDVVVIDTRGIARGATGHSTAKVSIVHELAYSQIADVAGVDAAREYAVANRHGLDWIRRRVQNRAIDCDWSNQAGITFVAERGSRSKIEAEARAFAEAGVDATTIEPDWPFPAAMAVCVEGQGQFDPVPFAHDLADEAAERGAAIVTGVRAKGVRDSGDGATLVTDAGDIRCRWVLAATGLPFTDRGGFFARAEPQTSYLIACRVDTMPPDGTYLAADASVPSLRTAKDRHGEQVLLVGGESHKTGQGGPTLDHYGRLQAWADEHLGLREITHRFMTEDFMTPDHIPFAGPLRPGATSVLVATGFNKWGFTNAVAAAEVNVAHVTGGPMPSWTEAFSSRRLPVAGGRELLKANANVGKYLVGGWLGAAARRGRPAPGEGAVVRRGGQPVAVSVDADGRECAVAGMCPHLGGILTWNDAEETWDCPLHGSRFERDGTLLHGPATDDLRRKD
jgi:glycine/D-amino acid oxidase-like deaminating enzyme/nitrite reductase/ring-hydroxylating ferredoxin subunit